MDPSEETGARLRYYEPRNTYYAVDVMSWGGYSLYDCTAEFRFYWLRTKLEETKLECSESDFAVETCPYFEADAAGIDAAHAGPLPYLRDGLLFYDKRGHYARGLAPLVALFKDDACTRRFNVGRDGAVLAVLVCGDGTAATADGATVRVVADATPPLAPGELARFVVGPGASGALEARFDQRCSPKRAAADSASKITFFLRHQTAPLSIDHVKAVAAAGRAT